MKPIDLLRKSPFFEDVWLRRFLFGLLFLASAYVLFQGIGAGSLSDWDECIYSEVAREAVRTGDYVNLKFNGYSYLQGKPPLLIYLVSAAYRISGVSTFASRFWPALFGLGTVVATVLIAQRLKDYRTGFIAGLVLLGCGQFVLESRRLMLDVPATFFTAVAAYSLLRCAQDKRFLYVFFGSTGLAVMTRGLVGLLPLIIAFFYVVLASEAGILRGKVVLYSFVLFLLIVTPWYVQQFMYGYTAQRLLLTMYLDRITTPLQGHDYGNDYYLQVLGAGFSPWIYLAIPAFAYQIFLSLRRDRRQLIPLIWALAVLAVLVLAQTKLPTYLIPLYPALSIMVANMLGDVEYKRLRPGLAFAAVLFLLTFHIQRPLYCNNDLQIAGNIADGGLRVHDSVGSGACELFYLGKNRYNSSSLMAEDSFYASKCDEYSGAEDLVKGYAWQSNGTCYMVFSKPGKAYDKAAITPIPADVRYPVNECYRYMPSNLLLDY